MLSKWQTNEENHLEYKPILLEFAKLTKNNIVT